MAKDDDDVDEIVAPEDRLPDEDAAKEFYAKYEPKEILGRLVFKFLFVVMIVCFFFFMFLFRGVSSTVRRCIEKETGKEFAAKIIDLSNENNEGGAEAAAEATRQEVEILRLVAGHPYISECYYNNRFVFYFFYLFFFIS